VLSKFFELYGTFITFVFYNDDDDDDDNNNNNKCDYRGVRCFREV